MEKIVGVAGVVLSAVIVVAGAAATVALGNFAVNDIDFPTCAWFAGNCRESYVNTAEITATVTLFGVALVLLFIGALKGEFGR